MLIVVVFMFVFDSCELNIGGSPDCSASTSDVSEITDTSAKVGGVAYGASISTRGIVYGTQPNPARYKNSGKGTGAFTIILTGLTPSTKYYYKAWVLCQQYGWGEEKSFTTLARGGD